VALRPEFHGRNVKPLAVRPLAIITEQPMWFLHVGNAGSSQSTPDDSNAVGQCFSTFLLQRNPEQA